MNCFVAILLHFSRFLVISISLVSAEISNLITSGGAKYVDGSVISFAGLRLYLAGPHATDFKAIYFPSDPSSSGGLQAIAMRSSSPVAASYLKATYSGWDKAVSALTIATHALAKDANIEEEFRNECLISQPSFVQRTNEVLPTIPGKAWRYVVLSILRHYFSTSDTNIV